MGAVKIMKFPKNEKEFEELMKGIKWNRIIPPLVSVLQPVIIFSLWLGFAKMDKRADAVAKLIALAEPLPFDIDLNVPQPVVLASLYHSVDEMIPVLEDILTYLQDLEVPSADKIINDIKEDLKETIVDPIKESARVQAFIECKENAKKNLTVWPFLYGANIQTFLWIQTCLAGKGISVSTKWIKEQL